MNIIGTTPAGNPIVELDQEFRIFVMQAQAILARIPVMTKSQAEALAPDLCEYDRTIYTQPTPLQ